MTIGIIIEDGCLSSIVSDDPAEIGKLIMIINYDDPDDCDHWVTQVDGFVCRANIGELVIGRATINLKTLSDERTRARRAGNDRATAASDRKAYNMSKFYSTPNHDGDMDESKLAPAGTITGCRYHGPILTPRQVEIVLTALHYWQTREPSFTAPLTDEINDLRDQLRR